MSEREKQIPYANAYIRNLKKKKGSEEPRGRKGKRNKGLEVFAGSDGPWNLNWIE